VIRTFNITGAIPALLLRRQTGAPLFVSYGYSLPSFIRAESGFVKYFIYRLVEVIALSLSNYIFAATPDQVKELGSKYGIEKTLWLPNFVNVEQFRPTRAVRSKFYLFVGRFTSQKNLHVLLRAIAKSGIRRRIKLVGQGELETSLRVLAADLDLDVEFVGVVPNDRLPSLYASAWAFILPSLYEGMPKALLEAMSSGTPCLGTNVDGIKTLLVDGENGILSEPTEDGLGAALRRLEDRILRERIGKGARAYVEANFSMDKILEREFSYFDGAMR
jgi:glycosyltransferase involved in cell wall biosynthesis